MKSFYIKSLIIFMAAGLLIFLIVFNSSWLTARYETVRNIRVKAFSGLSFFSTFISELKTVSRLTRENLDLKNENTDLKAQLAVEAELKDQNEFLRKAADLNLPKEYKLTDARTFNIEFSPEGHYALVNKGRESGIVRDDIVITPSKVLMGRIADTYDGYSRIELISNRDLKVTVRLLDKNITAIARGMLNEGLRLDFISQNDELNEGERVVTNGNDLFPYGLIVGSVKKVGSNDGNLFKNVIVEPEFKNIAIDRVLILTK